MKNDMNYELTDVTIYDKTQRSSAEMEDMAINILNASNSIKREIFFKEAIAGGTALLLYMIFLVPFAGEYLSRGTLPFKIMVFIVTPILFTVLSAKISSKYIRKHYYEVMNKKSNGNMEKLTDTFNVVLFRQELSRGRVWLTAVSEDTVSYNIEIDGNVKSRSIKLRSASLTWGSDATKITFYPDSISFELAGKNE